jgi:signal transduction histidine kinase
VPGDSASTFKSGSASASSDSSQPDFEACSVIGSFCVSPSGEILRANRAFLDMAGFASAAEFAERNLRAMLVSADDWQLWERAARGERIRGKEFALRARGDRELVLKGDIWPVAGPRPESRGLLGAFIDISESKLFRAAVQRAARSEVLGSLASGMVHDIRNLLTVLIGNLYLVAEGVRDRPELLEQARRARDAAKRGAELTQNLLSFARESSAVPQSIDPKRLLTTLKPLLDHAAGSRARLDLAIPREVASVHASAAQLESVILNLVINARDAVAEGGVITIGLGNVMLEADAAARFSVEAGRFVRITVEDNGAGIAESARARVFEPFFTTKTEGRGTGLGLTMVKWFAEACGGAVDLSSEPGRGTAVTLLFPAAGEPADASPSMTMPLSSLPGGDEAVLIVAADRSVADTLRDSLAVLGYSVEVAHGSSGISRLLETGKFKLVVLDSSADTSATPRRLAAAIGRRFPAVSTLVVIDADSSERDGPGRSRTLQKPFTLKELATLARRILDGDTHV